jgi:hypothetical protein
VFSALLAIEALADNNLSLVIETPDGLLCIVPFVRQLKLLHLTSGARQGHSSGTQTMMCVSGMFLTVRQKGLAVMSVFSRTLMIEASIANLQPRVMCTADGQSCIALGGDARIKICLSAVVA